ncbi:MAG TPA: class I SAM-dependent methyltransferase [Casimicrobiaceae bacterium]
MIRWFDELACYRRHTDALRSMRRVVEDHLSQCDMFEGYCCVRNRIEIFRLPQAGADNWRNLRESFVCGCGLNGRMRMVFQAFADAAAGFRSAPRALVFERLTPFYAALAQHFPFVHGCEYVAPNAAPGSIHRVRDVDVVHEDMQALSAPDGGLDLICHADVLEHVADHRRALSECARALAPGGRLLFTCPFFELDSHVVRATVENGTIVHRLPAGYHDNPMSAEGSLVFTHFGWPLFDDIRAAGFSKARIGILYDPFQGIVSNNNPYPEGFMWPVLFEATR